MLLCLNQADWVMPTDNRDDRARSQSMSSSSLKITSVEQPWLSLGTIWTYSSCSAQRVVDANIMDRLWRRVKTAKSFIGNKFQQQVSVKAEMFREELDPICWDIQKHWLAANKLLQRGLGVDGWNSRPCPTARQTGKDRDSGWYYKWPQCSEPDVAFKAA